MKILIAADMEGITGVTHWDHVDPDHIDYSRFRRLMTSDVNAAVRGVCEGGVDEILVTDGHAYGTNIIIDDLDPCAHLIRGDYSPLAMIQGIGQDVDGVILVGYHARAGSQNAILDHTWSSKRVCNLWLNDILVGEYGLSGAVAGHFGAPVLMITGDQTTCAQAKELLGDIETVVVKIALSRMAAECFPPQTTEEQIQKTALQAIRRLKQGDAPKPFVISPPVKVTIDFFNTDQADQAAILPGSTRVDGRRVTFTAEDMLKAYLAFQAMVALVSLS